MLPRPKRSVVPAPGVLLVALVAFAPPAGAAAGTHPSPACGTWRTIPAPMPAGAGSAGLRGVSLRASNDAWAVGFSQPPDLTSEAALVEHWNGRRWRVVPTPALGPVAELDAVAAISSADAWAVGSRTPPSGSGIVPLAMRWNGSAWTSVPVPAPPAGDGALDAVASTSSSDVWAVGDSISGSNDGTLIEHFDGTSWQIVAGPNPAGASNRLTGVTAIGPADAWAVGFSESADGVTTLLEHWNGSNWMPAGAPAPGGIPQAVAAVATNDLWAVGTDQLQDSLAEHFDGSSWTVVRAPSPSALVNELNGVAAVSSARVWAAGAYYDHGLHLLVEGWDGTSWRVAFEGDLGSLSGVSSLPGGLSMAVGHLGDGTAVTPVVAFTC